MDYKAVRTDMVDEIYLKRSIHVINEVDVIKYMCIKMIKIQEMFSGML